MALSADLDRQRTEAPKDATLRVEVSELTDALDRLADTPPCTRCGAVWLISTS